MPLLRILSLPLFAAAVLAHGQPRLDYDEDERIDESEWTQLFEDVSHNDFYFGFLEEDTDPEEVFLFEEDGLLRVKGKDKPIGYLQTLDEYSNYELRFEWRWPDEPGDGGILIHSADFPHRSIWPQSIKVQLKHKEVGDFWLFGHRLEVKEEQMPKRASERERRHRLADAEKKAGEWNEMKIRVKGDTIKTHLNGKLVNEGSAASVSSGFITIQAESANLEIRNMRLRELEEDDGESP